VPISNERIVWIDCEMTGLDSVNDALIEVAALVTDSELNILGDGVDVVIKPDDAALAQMNDFVRDMHTRSGLLNELPAGKTLAEAEEAVMAYIRKWVPDVRKAPLAGNSVGTDRVFLARDMPAVVEHLHYRVIDVSTIKELARRWFARAYFQAPAKLGGHRALGDIKDSIDELRYYREAVFVPAPGPDSATAQEISRRIAGQPAVIDQLTQGAAGKQEASGGALPAEAEPAS
jgi:oligoribonuclease